MLTALRRFWPIVVILAAATGGLLYLAIANSSGTEQQQLATIMKGYWTGFAKIGFPFSFGSPFWPFFNFTQQMQSLAPPTPQTETDFATTHNCAFWAALEAS